MKGAFLALAASALLGSTAAGSLHDRRHAHQAFHLRRNTPAPADSATCSCTTYVTTFYGEASLVQETQMAQETQAAQETQMAEETTISTATVQPMQMAEETTTSVATVQPTTTVQSTQYTTITVVPTGSSSAAQQAAPVASSSSVESSSAPAAPVSSVESSSAPAAPASSVESSSAPAAPASSVESSSAPAAPASPVESSSAPAAPVAPTAFVTVCPTPGTYTIPATTMTLSSETMVAAPAMTTLSSSSESQTYGGVTTVVETSTTIVCPYATVSPTGDTVTSVIMTTTYVCPSSGTYVIAPTTTSVSEATVMVYPTPASYAAGTYTQPETTITITRTSDVFVCPYTSSTPVATEASSTSAPASAVPVSSAAPSSGAPSYAPAAASSSSAGPSSSAPAAVYPAASSSAAPSSSVPAAAAAVSSAAPSSAAPSSSAPEVAVPVSSTASSSAPAAPASESSSQASSVAVSSSAAAPSKSSTASPIGGGNQWCMTYSPYTSSGQCKDSTAVLVDIAIISSKGFSSVRIYSTDCNGLQNVGAAAQQHNLKLVLGVYISKTGISAAQAQVTEIVNWASGNWAAVEMIVIGNEAVFNHYASMSELAGFISSAKSTFQSAGFTGHVTTTEPMNIIQESGSILCSIVDVLSANIHPFFNPETTATKAGEFVAQQLKDLEKVCPGLSTYNLETGWPHTGSANGAAVPGSTEQEEAIKAIQEHAGGKSVFFSFIDDMWKEPGALGVEQSFGCSHLFGN